MLSTMPQLHKSRKELGGKTELNQLTLLDTRRKFLIMMMIEGNRQEKRRWSQDFAVASPSDKIALFLGTVVIIVELSCLGIARRITMRKRLKMLMFKLHSCLLGNASVCCFVLDIAGFIVAAISLGGN